MDIDPKILMKTLDDFAGACFRNSRAHGFWEQGVSRNKAEMVALIHSEASELLESLRDPCAGFTPSKHIPDFSASEEELADILIRVGDFAAGFSLRLGAAVAAKMQYNAGRPAKHGKKF